LNKILMKAVSKKSQGRNFCTLAAHNHKDPQRSTKAHLSNASESSKVQYWLCSWDAATKLQS
jgi:hypothetical protein